MSLLCRAPKVLKDRNQKELRWQLGNPGREDPITRLRHSSISAVYKIRFSFAKQNLVTTL